MPGIAKISVYRKDDDRRNRYATYKVVIDGAVAGNVDAGDWNTFKVPAGAHTVNMRYAWLGSNKVVVSTVPRQEAELLCTKSRWVDSLISIFLWNHYLHLRQLSTEDRQMIANATRTMPIPAPRDLTPGLAGA
jgi:hypothetical protein